MSNGLPIVLGLCAACLFALGVQLSRKGLDYADYKIGTWLTMVASCAAFWAYAPWGLPPPAWSWKAFLIFAGIGLMMPLVSSHCAVASSKILGPTISTTVAGVSPFFTVTFGILVLGEALSPGVALGTVAIVAGVMVMSLQGGQARTGWPLWALSLPIAAALIRALAQGFTKLGFEDIPSPFFAALVCYTVSTSIATGLHIRRGGGIPPLLRRPGLNWFVAAGLVNALAIALLYVALSAGDLVVVGPTVATYPVFTLALSALIFHQEAINWRKILGVFLVVPGVVLIASGL